MKNVGVAILVFIVVAMVSQVVKLALDPDTGSTSTTEATLTKESYLDRIREDGDDEFATVEEYECIYAKMIDDLGVDEVWRLDKQAQFGTPEEQDAAGEVTVPYMQGCVSY